MAKIPIKSVNNYPDVSDLFKAKNEQRLVYANRSFAEKLQVVERLRDTTRMWQNNNGRLINKK